MEILVCDWKHRSCPILVRIKERSSAANNLFKSKARDLRKTFPIRVIETLPKSRRAAVPWSNPRHHPPSQITYPNLPDLQTWHSEATMDWTAWEGKECSFRMAPPAAVRTSQPRLFQKGSNLKAFNLLHFVRNDPHTITCQAPCQNHPKSTFPHFFVLRSRHGFWCRAGCPVSVAQLRRPERHPRQASPPGNWHPTDATNIGGFLKCGSPQNIPKP